MLVVILAASKHVGQGVAQRVLTLAKRADVVEFTHTSAALSTWVLDPDGDVGHGGGLCHGLHELYGFLFRSGPDGRFLTCWRCVLKTIVAKSEQSVQSVKSVATSRLSDDALPLQGGGAKVVKYGQAQAGGREVIVRLSFVGLVERRDGLQFQNDLVIHDDVSDVVANNRAFVDYRETLLCFERHASQPQFAFERGLVDRFKEAWSKDAVDFHARAVDGEGQFFVEQVVFSRHIEFMA